MVEKGSLNNGPKFLSVKLLFSHPSGYSVLVLANTVSLRAMIGSSFDVSIEK